MRPPAQLFRYLKLPGKLVTTWRLYGMLEPRPA